WHALRRARGSRALVLDRLVTDCALRGILCQIQLQPKKQTRYCVRKMRQPAFGIVHLALPSRLLMPERGILIALMSVLDARPVPGAVSFGAVCEHRRYGFKSTRGDQRIAEFPGVVFSAGLVVVFASRGHAQSPIRGGGGGLT